MPTSIIEETPLTDDPPLRRKRFTRSDVAQMAQMEVFAGQRFELIDGDLIDKMGQSPLHASTIRRCSAALAEAFGLIPVLAQMPIQSGALDFEHTVPEPDLSVLTERKPEFVHRQPTGSELILAMEVSDTTLEHDALTKRDIYARSGVPEYWVLDLNDRRLLVYRDLNVESGEYASLQSYREDEAVLIASKSIQVSSLLPQS